MKRLTQTICIVSALGTLAAMVAFYAYTASTINGLTGYLVLCLALVFVPYSMLFVAARRATTPTALWVGLITSLICAGIAAFAYADTFRPRDAELFLAFVFIPMIQILVSLPAYRLSKSRS